MATHLRVCQEKPGIPALPSSIALCFLGPLLLAIGCGTSSMTSLQAGQSAQAVSTPGSGNGPVITSASSSRISLGVPFTYQITATNNPVRYTAQGLPAGLSVDAATGLISGTPQQVGEYDVVLGASNADGEGQMHLFLGSGNQSGNCKASIAPPAPAASSGFTSLSFCDDFNSLDTIDANSTGRPGYNWYTNLSKWSAESTLPPAYSITESVLSLTSTGWTSNYGLSTRDPLTGNGHAWIYGCFEARISFDPSLATQSEGWPSVWLFSALHAQSGNSAIWPELDIFEALTGGHSSYSGDYYGTLHQWQDSATIHYQNSNNHQVVHVDWTQWHTVAVLWVQGQVTWYLDGKPLMTQQYSATAPPNPLATTKTGITPTPAGVFDVLDTQSPGMELILGSAPGWPIQVDWVKVWQP
jgi:hypothetical protein